MGGTGFPALLLVIAGSCICIHPLAEGVRRTAAPSGGPLTLHADQATHGRPSQQRLLETGHESLDKGAYGLRTGAQTESKRSRAPYDRSAKPALTAATPPRRKTHRRVEGGGEGKVATTEKPSSEDDADSMAMADAGGRSSGAEDGGGDEKKTLAQQVADGKYGLIQELLPNSVERPGVISYASNPEVPKDTADNLGGLGQEDIWLAEDHVLVLAGGVFRDKGGNVEQPWPPIDDYSAPRRQVKIPEKPSIPPPFPVQLREGEPPRFIGDDGPPFPHHAGEPHFQNQGNYPTGSGPPQPGPWAGNGSLPAQVQHGSAPSFGPGAPHSQAPVRPQAPGERPPYPPPPNHLPYTPPPFPPQNGNFSSPFYPPVPFLPPGNLTEPFDEDDPSLYYPPPYDFYYPSDNSTEVPPGPLVPGIVLPPPPDFFSPFNETSDKEEAEGKGLPKKEKGSGLKPKGGARPVPRPLTLTKTILTTSTPGPKYLPVTAKPRDEVYQTTRKHRPLHAKTRPTLAPKEYSNRVTSAPPVEVIPVRVDSLPIAQEHADVGTGRETPPEPNKYNPQEKYPTGINQQAPLYYYNGQDISQIFVTPSPRPIYVEEFYQGPKGAVTPAPPKPLNKQVIYIFTSPEQQDVIANQVSSTELPQTLRERHKYGYERQTKLQGDNLGTRPEVPTPPRLENFHSYYEGSQRQFYDFVPSPVDPGSSKGFRFPDEEVTVTVSPTPSNYYLDRTNSGTQSFRQFGFGKDTENRNPIVYYPFSSNSHKSSNRTRGGIYQAIGGQVYIPRTTNFNTNPEANRPHVYDDANRGNEVTIVTPKPASQSLDTNPIHGEHRLPFPRGNGGVSIITVKPSVLYSGPVSATRDQNSHRQTKFDSREPIVISRPTYNTNSGAIKDTHRHNPQLSSKPAVSIVTPKPQLSNSGTALEDSLSIEPQILAHHSTHAQGNGRIRISQSATYSVRPISASQSHSTFLTNPGTSGESQVIIGQKNNDGREQTDSPYHQIYFPSSTSSPPKLQDGIPYFIDDHSEVGTFTSSPAPYHQSTPRAPKYVDIGPEDVQFANNARKKIPTAQYEEYFEANRGPSQPSQIGYIKNYDQRVAGGVYYQTTTPPTVQTTSRSSYKPREHQFTSYDHELQTTQSPEKAWFVKKPSQNTNRNPGIHSEIYTQSTPAPSPRQTQYQPQFSHVGQLNGHAQDAHEDIYIQTTPSPVQYQYAANQGQANRVTTPSPDFASVFNFPSSTFSPLPSYYTTQDASLFDDVTRNYFTIFGQKIGGQGKLGEANDGQRLQPTTPLPPHAEEFGDVRERPQNGRPTPEAPEEHRVVSLADDVRVNFRNPLPPVNPDSEFIVPVQSRPATPRHPAVQSAVRVGGAVVSYQLPGVDGKGVGGGSHYYFLTPQPASSDTRPRPFQRNNDYYQQGQRPVFNNYWAGLRSR